MKFLRRLTRRPTTSTGEPAHHGSAEVAGGAEPDGANSASARSEPVEPTAVEGAEGAAEMAGKAALEAIFRTVEDLVEQHGSVLVAKRRQRTYCDDYGRRVDEAWKSEIDYFQLNVVDDELFQRFSPQTIAEAQIQVLLETPQELRDAIGDIDAYFAIRIHYYIETLVEELDAQTPADVLDAADISPSDYEQLCADTLRASGWTVRVCGGSGDQGVDLVAERDGRCAVFQCKLYSKPVGNSAVQEVHTGRVFHGANIAAVVTPAGYTPSARAAAEQTGVLLLHHAQLAAFGEEV
jgi:restriction system protein